MVFVRKARASTSLGEEATWIDQPDFGTPAVLIGSMSGWSIQVASSPSEIEARAFLTKTSRQAGEVLADASPYTVTFDNDGTTYHRARFGGFETKNDAWDACKALKRKKIECYAVQQ